MNIEALCATAWVTSFLLLLVTNFNPKEHNGLDLVLAWVIIGWIPPIFYKIWTML